MMPKITKQIEFAIGCFIFAMNVGALACSVVMPDKMTKPDFRSFIKSIQNKVLNKYKSDYIMDFSVYGSPKPYRFYAEFSNDPKPLLKSLSIVNCNLKSTAWNCEARETNVVYIEKTKSYVRLEDEISRDAARSIMSFVIDSATKKTIPTEDGQAIDNSMIKRLGQNLLLFRKGDAQYQLDIPTSVVCFPEIITVKEVGCQDNNCFYELVSYRK